MSHAPDTTLLLGHSPDPDDAFMFYAMAAEKIDLLGYRFLFYIFASICLATKDTKT